MNDQRIREILAEEKGKYGSHGNQAALAAMRRLWRELCPDPVVDERNAPAGED